MIVRSKNGMCSESKLKVKYKLFVSSYWINLTRRSMEPNPDQKQIIYESVPAKDMVKIACIPIFREYHSFPSTKVKVGVEGAHEVPMATPWTCFVPKKQSNSWSKLFLKDSE